MFAIASLIKDSLGQFSFHNGVLHSLPAELCDPQRMQAYCRVSSPGWSVSEFGYHIYAAPLPKGGLLIFPALIITDGSRPSKRFHGYSCVFSKRQIEMVADGIIKTMNRSETTALRDQGLLIHDLRALSDAIYNSAYEAITFNEQGNRAECRKRLENIVASQGMLQMRTDALDFIGNLVASSKDENIPVFKKVDKVVRCFKSRAGQRKSVNLYGNSFQKTKGPNLLELVPYGLLDNALKYSPEDGEIDVGVVDEGKSTLISVTSFGPKIRKDEIKTIFNEGVRASAAIASNVPGAGIGLHMVEKITRELFGGAVSVDQVDVAVLKGDGVAYFQTTFEVLLPSYT